MKPRFITLLSAAAFGAFAAFNAQAQVFISQTYNVNAAIPDGNLTGLQDSHTITAPAAPIVDVDVILNISGTGPGGMVNGDIYAYLTHDTGISILLNRPGLRSGSSLGYDDSGFSSVTFDDAAANDVHVYRLSLTGGHDNPIQPYPSPLTGTWQPDGRDILPTSTGATFDAAARDASLNAFSGLNRSGEWTLFLADLQTGGTATLNSWTLNVTAVPEPHHYAIATALSLLGLAAWRKLRSRT